MQIVTLTKERYADWDKFCIESNDAWFWHTSDWLEYVLEYKPELKGQSKSFFVISESQIMGICPLILETTQFCEQKIREFSCAGSAGAKPALSNNLSQKKRWQVIKFIFSQVDQLTKENNVVKVSFKSSPLESGFLDSHTPKLNVLSRFGYIDVSLHTQVLDLSKSLNQILKDMRKGHRAAIKRWAGPVECIAFDAGNISQQVIGAYRALHCKASGRETRSPATFDMMFNWIVNGKAVLLSARMDGKFVGFILINTYKNGAYFHSSCNDPAYAHISLSHILTWEAIKMLKNNGIHWYEMGIQQYASLPHNFPSPKEIQISLFKRGFGGFTVPLYIGEKYNSRDYYIQVSTKRIQKYASTLEMRNQS